MEISKKEVIVSFFAYFILLTLVISCLVVLKANTISLILSVFAIVYILLGTIITWSLAVVSNEKK